MLLLEENLSDKKNDEDRKLIEALDNVFYDLVKDDGHSKELTKKEEIREEKEQKRKREAMLAHATVDEGLNKDSLKKQKFERKELSKQEGADLEHTKEQEREPELHLEERDRNNHNYKQQLKSPLKVQGIDAETKDMMNAKIKPHTNTSVGIEDAGSPSDIRTPSATPDARSNIEKGSLDRFR